eukprot:TRINITY_DN28180_c0_g1_i1.p1 TRINITY_DN28180_c0_g1~~TRINITY_DN28180_c0_g1_i1.p1  ORF type:complete len:104 (-),score=17.48 TRINITY_DN28180_c0_g1_i1:72-383(-)
MKFQDQAPETDLLWLGGLEVVVEPWPPLRSRLFSSPVAFPNGFEIFSMMSLAIFFFISPRSGYGFPLAFSRRSVSWEDISPTKKKKTAIRETETEIGNDKRAQ